MIGPSFSDELRDAGLLGLPFSWCADGTFFGRENLTTEQNDGLDAVILAHDPEALTSATVNAERNRRIVAGASFDVTGYGAVPLTGREEDKVALMGLMLKAQMLKAAGVTVPILTVRDGVNANHMLTPDQMIELVQAGMLWIEATMAVSWAMKDGVAPFEGGIPSDFADDVYWPQDAS